MHLSDATGDLAMYQGLNQYDSFQYSNRKPPRPPTSVALDDNFDAQTTEAPTDWDVGIVRHGRDYEESITGYQNYVKEMERKLSGEDEWAAAENKAAEEAFRRTKHKIYNSDLGRTPIDRNGGGRSIASTMTPENGRRVSGTRGKIELIESKIMEDGPNRTISLWRERVAESSGGSSIVEDDLRSDANGHTYRRRPSNGSQARRTVSGEHTGSVKSTSKGDPGKGFELPKSLKSTYERSEYMVAYHQPSKGGYPMPFYVRSEHGSTVPLISTRVGSGFRSPQADQTLRNGTMMPSRRRSARPSQDRNEFMLTYPQTPPHSGDSVSSISPNGQTVPAQRPMSPTNTRLSIPPETINQASISRTPASGSTPVELILSSCDPSLLHIQPILAELGIQRVEHLRAIARLSEETRNREVKEQALRKGVTVVEWAILLDKLQTL